MEFLDSMDASLAPDQLVFFFSQKIVPKLIVFDSKSVVLDVELSVFESELSV